MDYQKISKIAGWLVFGIASIVYALTAEPTGSLWDCGEFITGAYKMEVVHPPGAPVFLLVGRMFTLVAGILSDNPENISYSINLMSGLCTAAAAMFVCWSTIIFGKLSLVAREEATNGAQNIALAGAGVVAGLCTAFCTSVWFSAVEGEVYAMSTMFTALVIWGMAKWYGLPDTKEADRWIVFSLFMAGLSTGVHLLSLLTLPAMALLYYYKKFEKTTPLGFILAGFAGVFVMVFVQRFIIVGVPTLWLWMEFITVNTLGLPKHSGLVPLYLLLGGLVYGGFVFAKRRNIREIQIATMSIASILVAFSTIGVVVTRAHADTPINMNSPSNAARLLPYLNREQYGERPLLTGPSFVDAPIGSESEPRYDYVAEVGEYQVTDQHPSYVYPPGTDMFFPRLGHDRGDLYVKWLDDLEYVKDGKGKKRVDRNGKPFLNRELTFGDNLQFFLEYQIGWMYIRYFMWNFAGRQNGSQGLYSWDIGKGHWISGIPFIDKPRVGNTSELTPVMKADEARNTYYMLPFLFGLVGLFYLFQKRPKDAFALLVLFFMTGLAIIIYSNQPPNEPRERDYVLVGSFFTYCMFIGLGVLGLFEVLREKAGLKGNVAAGLSAAVVMLAPLLMGTQNYDDNSRADHYGARDYASNFLNSVEENAIIFTYGDNDTYPLWYAQEVEGIRTDVRAVNLSLIQVDWYINQLRRKINDSEPIKFSVPAEKIRGRKRVQFLDNNRMGRSSLKEVVDFMGGDHPVTTQSGTVLESFLPTRQLYIDVDTLSPIHTQGVADNMKGSILPRINFDIPKYKRVMKGDFAIMDIIASNFNDRPIYFAVTVRDENLLGLQDYLQMEGLALRLVPVKKPKQEENLGGLGALGYGYVHAEEMYDNIMNKWQWGGFDKKKMFVDDKYSPSVQSIHFAIRRAASELLSQGKNKKAEDLVDKYFEAFPNFNFPYDWSVIRYLELYEKLGKYEEKAKPIIAQLLDNTLEDLEYLSTQDLDRISASGTLQQMQGGARNAGILIQRMASRQKDTALLDELQEKLLPYGVVSTTN